MSSGQPIQYSDIISPEVQKQLDALNKTVAQLTKELGNLNKATEKEDATAEDYNDTLRDTVEVTDDLLKLTRVQVQLERDIKKEKEKYNRAVKEGNFEGEKAIATIKKGEETLRKHNFVVKNATKLAIANKGSMTELSLELAKNRMAYRELNKEQRENSKIGGKLLKTIKTQDAAIKKLDASIGNHQRNVGNYTGALSAMGGKFGMVGAKITQVTTIFTTLGTAMKGATAATTMTSRAMKILRLALISTGIGAIVVALGTLIAYLTDTASGAGKLAKAMAPLKALFSTITSLVKQFGEGLALMLDGDFKGGFDLIANGVKNLSGEYERHLAIQKSIAELELQLHNLRKDNILAIQQLKTEQRDLLAQAKNADKYTLEERLSKQLKAIEIEKQIAAERQKQSALEIAILAQQSQLSEDSREEEIALQEARAAHSAILEEQNKRMATYNAYVESLTNKLNSQADAQERVNVSLSKMNSIMPENFSLTQDNNELLEQGTVLLEQEGEQAGVTSQQIIGGVAATSNAILGASEQNKQLQTAQALINTFAAVGIALATPGNIYTNLITSAVALATGLANVAKIQNTPAYAEGTEFLEGDSSGTDKIHIRANYGERIVPTDINRRLQGIPNVDLPNMVNAGQLYNNGLIDIARQQLGTQQEMTRTMKRFAYVDKHGNITYLSGDRKNYV